MKTISEYKDQALEALSGNWITGAVATLIYLLIVGGIPSICSLSIGGDSDSLSAGDALGNVVTILLWPMIFGYTILFLNVFRRNNPRVEGLFDGFKNYGKVLGTTLLVYIYQLLWCLLLIIPGIIKGYSYSMTFYVMKDNPSLAYNDAIEESMRLMQGHKMQLFLLDLSMIGWLILSFLTLGIGFLFLAPYNQTAHAAFYQDLIAEANPNSFDDARDYEEPINEPDFEEVK